MTLNVSVEESPGLSPRIDTFTIKFIDPCKVIVFGARAPLITDFTISMPSTAVTSQTFADKLTQYFALYNADIPLCQINPSLNCSPPAKISIGLDAVEVDASLLTLPGDIGTISCALTIRSANYPAVVDSFVHNFKIIVKCPLTNFSFSAEIPDYSFYIDEGVSHRVFT